MLKRSLVDPGILGRDLCDEVGVDLAVLDVGAEVGDVTVRASLHSKHRGEDRGVFIICLLSSRCC